MRSLWYWLTAFYPRKMPSDARAYQDFKRILINHFGVPNEPQVWITVSGQITSAHPQTVRLAWGKIANAAKRLSIHKVTKDLTLNSRKELQAKLEAAARKQIEIREYLQKLFTANPSYFLGVLKDTEGCVEFFVDDLMEIYEDEASAQDWSNFVKNQAIQENESRMQRANGNQNEAGEPKAQPEQVSPPPAPNAG